jgi:hypothetical protein
LGDSGGQHWGIVEANIVRDSEGQYREIVEAKIGRLWRPILSRGRITEANIGRITEANIGLMKANISE